MRGVVMCGQRAKTQECFRECFSACLAQLQIQLIASDVCLDGKSRASCISKQVIKFIGKTDTTCNRHAQTQRRYPAQVHFNDQHVQTPWLCVGHAFITASLSLAFPATVSKSLVSACVLSVSLPFSADCSGYTYSRRVSRRNLTTRRVISV